MSIKIYTAWRVPLNRLTEAIPILHDQVYAKVQELYEILYSEIDWVKLEDINKERLDKCDPEYRENVLQHLAFDSIWKVISSARDTLYRMPGLDLNCWINIWIGPDNYAYLIPGGEPTHNLKWEIPDWIEEYGYWNNTDPPDDITQEDWDQRYSDWDAVFKHVDGGWKSKYQLTDIICSANSVTDKAIWISDLEYWVKERGNASNKTRNVRTDRGAEGES